MTSEGKDDYNSSVSMIGKVTLLLFIVVCCDGTAFLYMQGQGNAFYL